MDMPGSAITTLPFASLPLAEEAVACVQDGREVQAPASAFGIPIADVSPPLPLAQFQTWIDRSTRPPTLKMYLGSSWVALYAIGEGGALALAENLTLPADPSAGDDAATKAYVDAKPGGNLLVNSAFDIWQEKTSYTLSSTAAKTHLADCWKAGTAASDRSVSRVAGGLKIQRAAATTSTAKVVLAQQLEHAEAVRLAGTTVTVSFDFSTGANYSPTGGPRVVLYYGTGTDEDIDLHVSSPAFATGGGNVSAVPTGSGRLATPPLAIPSGASEIALALAIGDFVGTAGADDSATIANVKLEIGNVATPYRAAMLADELSRCRRRYQKSFAQGTAPAENIGALSGEKRWRRFASGAAGEGLHLQLSGPMRATPTITFFNPAAANGEARNETGGADCSATASLNVSDSGFEVACTGDVSGAAGDWLGVHWVADARL
jgi:hypothetical protein